MVIVFFTVFLPGQFLVNLRNGFCDEWGRQLRHYVKLRNGCGDQEGAKIKKWCDTTQKLWRPRLLFFLVRVWLGFRVVTLR